MAIWFGTLMLLLFEVIAPTHLNLKFVKIIYEKHFTLPPDSYHPCENNPFPGIAMRANGAKVDWRRANTIPSQERPACQGELGSSSSGKLSQGELGSEELSSSSSDELKPDQSGSTALGKPRKRETIK